MADPSVIFSEAGDSFLAHSCDSVDRVPFLAQSADHLGEVVDNAKGISRETDSVIEPEIAETVVGGD